MSKGEQEVRKRGKDDDKKTEIADLEPSGTDQIKGGERQTKEMAEKSL